jgi:hypothetical protein
MRPLLVVLALLAAPALPAQSPRRDGGALAAALIASPQVTSTFRPFSPPQEPRVSKAHNIVVSTSALVGGIAMVIISKPDESDAEPIHPVIRVPVAFVVGAFIGAVVSTQILRLFGD